MAAVEIFTLIRDVLRTIPLNPQDSNGEALFEAVELWKNRRIGQAMQKLIITKKRVCLVVPTNIRRDVRDTSAGLSVLGTKYAEVSLVFSDVAYFKPEQAVTFGTDVNLGLFGFDEAMEAALTGRELSPFGGIICGDTGPVVLADSEAKDAAGREAWMMDLLVPIGLVAASVR